MYFHQQIFNFEKFNSFNINYIFSRYSSAIFVALTTTITSHLNFKDAHLKSSGVIFKFNYLGKGWKWKVQLKVYVKTVEFILF